MDLFLHLSLLPPNVLPKTPRDKEPGVKEAFLETELVNLNFIGPRAYLLC